MAFSTGIQIALSFVIQSYAISALFVLLFLSYIAYNTIRNALKPPVIGTARWRFLRTPVDHYLLSLFISDLLLAISGLMNIKWVREAGLPTSTTPFCTAQGAIQNTANLGIALASMAIAIHTFLVLFLRWKAPEGRWLPMTVLALIWTFVLLVTVVASQTNKDPSFYGPAKYWCWIDAKYEAERIGLEYAVLWFAAIVNILLYVPLFLCLRGNIVVDPSYTDGSNKKPRIKITWKSGITKYAWARKDRHEEATNVARQMLAYPIVYIIMIVPISVVRWIEFSNPGVSVPSAAVAFVGICFAASGSANVLLYVLTRPGLLPSFKRFRTQESDDQSDNGVDGLPNITTIGLSTSQATDEGRVQTSAHQNGRGRDRSSKAVPPMPMLEDDDADEEEIGTSPWTPTPTTAQSNHGRTLNVPGHTKQAGSWTSETSKTSVGHSSDTSGYDVEKSLPYAHNQDRM